MTDEGVLEAARAVRPYLRQLVGPRSDAVDAEIADLLRGTGDDRVDRLERLLRDEPSTEQFLLDVLGDAPHFRPPELQPGSVRGGDYRALAGDVQPVRHAGRYACPRADYVWYRPAVGVQIPSCPTHELRLTRL